MATKSKSKVAIVLWLLLVTFGLKGVFFGLDHGGKYFTKDYFQTSQFGDQLNQFIDYLSIFELSAISKEEAKKEITVTQADVEEHRYRYGNLAEQIANIKNQYEIKIQDAHIAKNQDVAEAYIVERDEKIADITMNFKSDEYVRAKIVTEKEQQLDKYFNQVEGLRADFFRYKTNFQYYLENTTTGHSYTNSGVNNLTSAKKTINEHEMLFVQNYPNVREGYLSNNRNLGFIESNDEVNTIIAENKDTFAGYIWVPKSATNASFLIADYYNFQQEQWVFFIYTISSLLALLLSGYLAKKKIIFEAVPVERLRFYYQRIPLEVRIFLFLITGFYTLITFANTSNLYFEGNIFSEVVDLISGMIITAPFVAIMLIQGQYLLKGFINEQDLKKDWQESVIRRISIGIKEAFLIRSIGFKVLILLGIIFAAGIGFTVVIMSVEAIIIYAPLFLVVVIPTVLILLNRIGYFNRIVNYAKELARGNFEPDLPVKDKSILGNLAQDINTLKHGVKESLSEQAKSERLKTELITNVSHDLRTPLTSIITYTELLKTPGLTQEEQDDYIQIIDRKSKRLKVLIDDLFEASKMVSGSVELTKEKIDLVQLLQQALAEYTEAISESTLQLRVTKPEKPLYMIVDGQKLWRVFDNLIGNILKYSLENTRVFISVKALPDKAIITFKNVTKYEIGEGTDELFERFKRGDTSRHTEGSGLGLAIAKSIVDLHGGSLDIEVDGDLFKVTITLGV